MRHPIPLLALSLTVSVGPLQTEPVDGNSPRQVLVYLEIDGTIPVPTLNLAKVLTSDIFATAGVRLRWRSGAAPESNKAAPCPAPRDRVVTINLSFTPPPHSPAKTSKTLAYTYPYASPVPSITILYDRLPVAFRVSLRLSATVLAYVLAHEISHVLQRIDRHSETGVMKAYWTPRDYADMQRRTLTFAREDVLLIHLGMDSWAHQSCPPPAEAATSVSTSQNN